MRHRVSFFVVWTGKKGYTIRNRAENRDFGTNIIQNCFDLQFITKEVYFRKLKKIIGGREAQQSSGPACELSYPGNLGSTP